MTSNQKKTCDRLWQIKVTESGICSLCGKPGNEGHHIMKRRYLNTRWDISNGRCLCRKCHAWAESNPYGYIEIIIIEIGAESFDDLMQKSKMIVKQFYDEIKESLR